ncbi:MAG: enoyl-CoA hydratase-related protein [Ferruginibacter sp.]|nr:enoyl-CoA hydratase-related protein [Ferruginibacter sp.]
MPSILFELKENIAIVRLNRPDKFNAFNREMALLLQEVLDTCAADPTVRVIFLTGEGKAFCAGQDLAELTGEDAPGFEKILSEHYNPIISRIRNLAKPVVCAVNGVAAGAGANLAISCDIVVAVETASFIQAFSKIGLIPDSGGTFMLPRLVGFQKATALMMLGDKVSAAEAERIGMIYRVLPVDNFEAEAFKIASALAGLPPKGLAYTKEALNASFGNSLDQQLSKEDSLQLKAANTYDYKEGVQAFIEKRAPQFRGE